MSQRDDPFEVYRVVVNDEEQFSIWPEAKPLPPGWRAMGEPASREECLEHIERVWVDMRPRSLRERMARANDQSTR
jgi:MbtH protein